MCACMREQVRVRARSRANEFEPRSSRQGQGCAHLDLYTAQYHVCAGVRSTRPRVRASPSHPLYIYLRQHKASSSGRGEQQPQQLVHLPSPETQR